MLNSESLYKILHERHAVQRKLASATFELWQRLGFHVVGDHFYDSIPNTGVIKERYAQDPRPLQGLRTDWTRFQDAACELIGKYIDDYVRDRASTGYVERNSYFAGLDALFYYAYLRDLAPRRVIEIGQGFSTRIALAALAENSRLSQRRAELVSIDPYQRLVLEREPNAVEFKQVRRPLQDVVHDLAESLSDGDLLFVDSSHVFKFGSDVQMLFELVYPQLDAGVRVHVHDVFTPFDYPLDWMIKRKQFWNEQYFLETFLAFNHSFRIDAPVHYLSRLPAVQSLLANQGDQIRLEGSSFYFCKVR